MSEPKRTWRVVVDGKTFHESDLTFGDLDDIAAAVGRQGNGWLLANPYIHPSHAKAILAAFLRRLHGITWAEALDRAAALPITMLNDFEPVDDDDLPLTFTDGYPDPTKGAPTTGG